MLISKLGQRYQWGESIIKDKKKAPLVKRGLFLGFYSQRQLNLVTA